MSTLREKLYDQALNALNDNIKDDVQNLFNSCIQICNEKSKAGVFQADVPYEVESLYNTSSIKNSAIIKALESKLAEVDLYIEDCRKQTFDAPHYVIKFDTPKKVN